VLAHMPFLGLTGFVACSYFLSRSSSFHFHCSSHCVAAICSPQPLLFLPCLCSSLPYMHVCFSDLRIRLDLIPSAFPYSIYSMFPSLFICGLSIRPAMLHILSRLKEIGNHTQLHFHISLTGSSSGRTLFGYLGWLEGTGRSAHE